LNGLLATIRVYVTKYWLCSITKAEILQIRRDNKNKAKQVISLKKTLLGTTQPVDPLVMETENQ
jgi:hypothetical protein